MMPKNNTLLEFRKPLFDKAIIVIKEVNIPQLENVLKSYEQDLELEDFNDKLLQRLYNEGSQPFLNDYRSNIEKQIKGFAQVLKTQMLIDVDVKIRAFSKVWNEITLSHFINITTESAIAHSEKAFSFDNETQTFYLKDSFINGYLTETFKIYAYPEDERFIKVFDEIYALIEKHYPTFEEVTQLKNFSFVDPFETLKMYKVRRLFAGIHKPIVKRHGKF